MHRVYRGTAGDSAVHSALITDGNAGPLFVNFIGHGNVDRWSGSSSSAMAMCRASPTVSLPDCACHDLPHRLLHRSQPDRPRACPAGAPWGRRGCRLGPPPARPLRSHRRSSTVRSTPPSSTIHRCVSEMPSPALRRAWTTSKFDVPGFSLVIPRCGWMQNDLRPDTKNGVFIK